MVSGALAAPAEVAAWMRIAFFCEFHGISWKFTEFRGMCGIHDSRGNSSFPVKRTSETPMKPMVSLVFWRRRRRGRIGTEDYGKCRLMESRMESKK